MRTPLLLTALLLTASTASAWELGDVGSRRAELERAHAKLDRRAMAADIEKRATQPRAPGWVTKGAFRQGKLGCAVGSASGIRNFSLGVSTAENRAAAELRKLLSMPQLTVRPRGGDDAVGGISVPAGYKVEISGAPPAGAPAGPQADVLDWYKDAAKETLFALICASS